MEIEELPDLKVNWIESYKYLAEPLLEYVWEVASDYSIIFVHRNELLESNSRQNAAYGTVAKSLPQNRVILPKSFV